MAHRGVHVFVIAALFIVGGCVTGPRTSGSSSSELQSWSSEQLCKYAIREIDGVVTWDNSYSNRPYSTEARRRGYTPDQCASHSGITSLSGPAASRSELWEKYHAGKHHKAVATANNGAFGAAWNQPSKQRAIELAIELCRIYGGVSCSIKNLASEATLANRPSKDICNLAIKISGGKVAWDTRLEVAKFSAEAKSRGYTPEQCATLTGRTAAQAGQSEAE